MSILRNNLHCRARKFRRRSQVGFAYSNHFVGNVAHPSLYSPVPAFEASASI